jgi:hypothetical protein
MTVAKDKPSQIGVGSDDKSPEEFDEVFKKVLHHSQTEINTTERYVYSLGWKN